MQKKHGYFFLLKPESGEALYTTLKIILFIDNAFVIPGALLTVVIGIIYGLFTNWGFFKHRWIVVKWIISITVILVGTFYFHPNLEKAIEAASQIRSVNLNDILITMPNTQINLFSSFLQGVALIFLVIISVFKPWRKKRPQ